MKFQYFGRKIRIIFEKIYVLALFFVVRMRIMPAHTRVKVNKYAEKGK